MPKIVGVRFKDIGKIYYFSPNDIDFEVGDGVIVETVRGVEFGKVALAVREVDESQLVSPLKPVIRKATEKDFEVAQRNVDKKPDAMKVAKEKIEKHKLNMKLIDCEFTFDNTKVIFYFTSESRVDFRELVKDLASHFRIRIELRQVGIRDEAKLLGGLGPCGRACCCSSCLGDFARVSIKMAKTQGLSLNPGKISGLCGRLMCCLQYENDYYSETYKLMPKINSEIKTPDGKAIVMSNDMLKKIVTAKITLHDGSVEIKQYPLDKIKAKHTLSVDDHDEVSDDLKGILD
ncbi:MAG: stage 0 sporulation family protein [Clostridia bacterium]|nr:stage 0 sporulation family protein [Clostridia bacterium]